MAITPLRDKSSHTKPIRRIFSSRSSLLNPSPLERCVRTTSPSRTSTFAPIERRRSSSSFEIVLFPAPDMPVNHRVKPLCTPYFPVRGEMDTALLGGVAFPPPAPGAHKGFT